MAKSKKPTGGDGYDVGYRKPPKAGQFKKGQSGNPGGRKKGSQNIRTIYAQVYGETMELAVNGKKRVVSGLEAIVMREFQLGMSGDGRVICQIINRHERFDEAKLSTGVEETSEDDRAIINRAMRRRDAASADGSDQPRDVALNEGGPDGEDDVDV